jgi:hypothetical protein
MSHFFLKKYQSTINVHIEKENYLKVYTHDVHHYADHIYYIE